MNGRLRAENRGSKTRRLAERAGRPHPRTEARGSETRRLERGAFTLVEMLVAVGAVALIAVGLARVFSAAGKTVRVGGVVSRLNESAALLERQIREDISRMTRNGFLVIVNERAGEGLKGSSVPPNEVGHLVRLSADDPSDGRQRRIDQFIIFAEGTFETKREAVVRNLTASSTQARIYYGHGLRWTDPANRNPIDIQDVDQDDDHAQVNTPAFGSPGPNQYASQWDLMRHVTLLAEPSFEEGRPFSRNPYIQSIDDNEYQIAGQPAAPSIFRNLDAANKPSAGDMARDDGSGVEKPGFACGVVDIATTSLGEIRAIVLDAINPGEFRNEPWVQGAGGIAFEPGEESLTYMKQWMDLAFPMEVEALQKSGSVTNQGYRMHCERQPPDLLGTRASGQTGQLAQPDFRRADQMMLMASNFVPACTEFIVEWSFGKTYQPKSSGNLGGPPGEIIWHGMDRWVDFDGDGEADPTSATDKRVARPYRGYKQRPYDSQPRDTAYEQDSVFAYPDDESNAVLSDLIHKPGSSTQIPSGMLYSYFGYVDPTYVPPQGSGKLTRDWPWPKMLRITMSLADPVDPTTERTFQFIVELPQRGAPAQN